MPTTARRSLSLPVQCPSVARSSLSSSADGQRVPQNSHKWHCRTKAKGLAKEAAGTVAGNEETKAEGRLEREGDTTEGNKAYFRNLIEETNRRAGGRS